MLRAAAGVDHRDMTEVLRLYDADRSALAARVQAARTTLGAAVTVSTYTYWYTSRPPVHEAILLRAEAT